MRLKLPTIRFHLPKFLVKKPEVKFSLGKTNLSRKQKALRILSVLLLVVGTLTVFLVVKTKPTKAAWYSSGWTYRVKLTVDQTKISGASALTNFPVLVSITNAGLQTYAQSDGDDILFTSADGTTKLNHEIESYTSASGILVAWVQIPSLSATVDTDFYMYYGNAAVASQQSVTSTWDSTFKGVWHSNDSSGTTVAGSTSTPNNGTKLSSTEPAVAATGKVAGGLNYDGTNDKVTVPDDNSLDIISAGTVSLWVKRDTTTTWDSLICKGSANDDISQNYGMEITDLGGAEFYLGNGSSGSKLLTSSFNFSSTVSYYHIVGTWNGTTQSIYINGTLNNSMAQGVTPAANVSPILIGLFSTSVDPFDGIIDEVRVASSARSADWIGAEYNNINAPSTFLAVGTTETAQSNSSNLPPVLYWNFDEGYGATANDISRNSNNGTFGASTAAPLAQPEDMCASGKCLKFDGSNDYVSRTYSSDTELDPGTASFSAAAWFRHPSTISAQQNILTRFNAGGWQVYMTSTGTVCFGIDNDGTSFPSDSTCSTASYADSSWHFVEAVKSTTTTITLYIDGKQVGTPDSSITSSSITGTSPTFYVGINSNGTSNPWSGYIDEVAYFAYAKTATQVLADFESKGTISQSSTTFGTNEPNTSLSNGLVEYWKMDDNVTGNAQTITDASGNAKNGTTAYGANTTGMSCTGGGKYSYACDLDGTDDYISVASPTLPTGDFTYSAWVYPDSITSRAIFFGADGSGGSELKIWIDGSNELNVQLDGATAINGVGKITVSTWTHVAVSRTGSNVSTYINGALDDSGTSSATLNFSSCSLLLGAMASATCTGTLSQYFDGKMDDLRIYNRSLNTSEIMSLYDWAPSAIGHWKLDEGTGTTAYDSSGNTNTGTLTNGPTWDQGKYSKGVSFDSSNDYIGAGNSTSLQITGALSLSAWVNFTDLSSQRYVIAKHGNTSNRSFGLFVNGSGKLKLEVSGDGVDANMVVATGATTLSTNTWYHISGVYIPSTSVTVYLNGISDAQTTTSVPAALFNTAANLNIGAKTDGSSPASGTVDNALIFNYPRTQKQIVQDMNANHPAVGSPVGSPVGYWKFDEGYGTTTNNSGSGGSSLDMTLVNAAWTNNGKYNKALDFNGTSAYAAFNDSSSVEPTGDMTLSAWFKLDTLPSVSGTDAKIIFKSHSLSPWESYELFVESLDNKVYVQWVNTSGTYYATLSTTAVTVGTWYYAAGVKSGNLLSLYVNGKYQSAIATTGTMYNSNSQFNVGAAGSERTDGIIDEVKIYNYSLNADEVKLDMNQGKAQILGSSSTDSTGTTADNSSAREYCIPGDATSCSAPIAEWNFDEHTGSTVNDKSGNGLTATYTAATWKSGCKFGSCLNLANNNVIEAATIADASSASLDFTNAQDFSLFAWVKLSATDTTVHIVNNGGTAAADDGYTLRYGSGTVKCRYADGVNNDDADGSITLTDNAWHFIGCIMDRNGSEMGATGFYNIIDGRIAGSDLSLSTGNGGANTDAFTIGETSTSEEIAGHIDRVVVYNYARKQSQLAWDYNRGAPLAWWKMDECSGTTLNDSSGNSLNGTITIDAGGANTTIGTCSSGVSTESWNNGTTGKINSSFDADGNGDRASVADNNILDITGDFTLSAWINREANTTGQVISKTNGGTSGGYALLTGTSGEVYCRTNNGTTSNDSYTATGIVSSGTGWHHIAAVRTGTSCRVFVDGIDKTVTAATHTTLTANALTLNIASMPNATELINAKIDDARVYNYALTATQLKTLYNNGAVNFGPSTGSP
jgi:hypothetical protein